jgi:hypothetical protein
MKESYNISTLDPEKVQEMLKKNYTIEMIKDYTDSALNEHYKKI